MSRCRALNATAPIMSTSSNPVVADQQVSRRSSVSASIVAGGPRHEVAARAIAAVRAATTTAAVRRGGFAAQLMPMSAEHGANQIQAAIDVPADQELFGPAPLQLDALKVAGSFAARR